ncbi:MAG: CheC, inhibitor of methylation / FliN fusion protein [Thermoleophilia bacterium]|nr:CheC, inhibitor of methylation / FliN fusion protein [Thermoleophilia bacterium]
MSDSWLMGDDADGGYLGMDDPAMPDTAPAPPSAPTAVAEPAGAGSWLGGDDGGGSDDWLGGAPTAPQDGHVAGAAPVMDGQGDWMAQGGHGEAPAVTPGMAPAAAPAPVQQYAQPQQQAAPMAMTHAGDISVMTPQLPQVQHTPRGHGNGAAAMSELSGLVLDVEVQVEVGLGNAALTVEEFLEMGRGSVVELDTPIDAPIELKVRGKLIARGQLVSINGSYGMRIVEMLDEEG